MIDDEMSPLTVPPTLADEIVRLRPMSDAAVEGLAILSEAGFILEANPSLGALAGRDPRALHGLPIADLIGPAGLASLRAMTGLEDDGEGMEVEIHRPDGALAPAALRLRVLDLLGQSHTLLSFEDLRSRRAAEERIGRSAQRDPLTGLRNRAGLDHALLTEMRRVERHGGAFAVLCLDLDGFKPINDVYGHATGDEALRIVATRLIEVTRETDFAFRLGGDEFLIVQSYAAEAHQSARLAERVIAAIVKPFFVGDTRLTVGVSIGIAHFPGHGDSPAALLRNADAALYRAKQEGKGCHRFFDPFLNEAQERRRAIEAELLHAIDRGELDVVYEPEMETDSGVVRGFEASLRWSSAVFGPVDPAVFLPIAWEAGVLTALWEWVIHEACREAASWARPLGISIRLPSRLFEGGDIAATCGQALAASGLLPRRLRIDIGEATHATGAATVGATLAALRLLGARIGLHEFGAKSASIATLAEGGFDQVRVDRSCLGAEADARLRLRAIIAACAVFGVRVSAGEVVSAASRDALAAAGCHVIQGEVVGPPRSISAFSALTGGAADPGKQGAGALGALRERLALIDPWSIRVLVVDDSDIMAETLCAMLAAFGFTRVDRVTDGATAMRRLERGAYGLVISDWNMAPVSGIELLGLIRADPRLRDIRFLMLTANARAASRLQARDAGVNGFLVKPFRPDVLATRIREIFAPEDIVALAG